MFESNNQENVLKSLKLLQTIFDGLTTSPVPFYQISNHILTVLKLTNFTYSDIFSNNSGNEGEGNCKYIQNYIYNKCTPFLEDTEANACKKEFVYASVKFLCLKILTSCLDIYNWNVSQLKKIEGAVDIWEASFKNVCADLSTFVKHPKFAQLCNMTQ